MVDVPPGEWWGRNLTPLIGMTAGWESGVAGDTLLHTDLRADNILLTADGPVVVDWPWASRGTAWVDVALMAPYVTAQGGPAPVSASIPAHEVHEYRHR